MLYNERYVGRVVWNRSKFVKVPGTNRRVARQRPESEWRKHNAPELRIVSDELWQRDQERLKWLRENYKGGRANGLLSRSATFADGANALLVTDEQLNGGGNAAVIRKIFTDRGILRRPRAKRAAQPVSASAPA